MWFFAIIIILELAEIIEKLAKIHYELQKRNNLP